MQWTSSGIQVWFFARGNIPGDITAGVPNPAGWGGPVASFSQGCDFDGHFKGLSLVSELTVMRRRIAVPVVGVRGRVLTVDRSLTQPFAANGPEQYGDLPAVRARRRLARRLWPATLGLSTTPFGSLTALRCMVYRQVQCLMSGITISSLSISVGS
jgi:hypothetical protein